MKSKDAYRTIAEVSKVLNLPPHVLRFWETQFPQINPVKRIGGRRYYRIEDIQLLEKIKSYLYADGYTIKGVQKILKGHNQDKILSMSADDPDKASMEKITKEMQSIKDYLGQFI